MNTHTQPFDDRTRDSDVERIRAAAEHFIDVVRNAVRAQLQERPHDPHQALLRALDPIEAWLVASGELDDSSKLVRKLDELLDTLDGKLPHDRQLTWLREPTDILDGLTPIEAVVGHRINAVLAAARSLPETPAPRTAPETPPANTGDEGDRGPG